MTAFLASLHRAAQCRQQLPAAASTGDAATQDDDGLHAVLIGGGVVNPHSLRAYFAAAHAVRAAFERDAGAGRWLSVSGGEGISTSASGLHACGNTPRGFSFHPAAIDLGRRDDPAGVALVPNPRKRAQFHAVAALSASLVRRTGALSVVDLCGGKGHLARRLARCYGVACVTIDADADLQAHGAALYRHFDSNRRRNSGSAAAVARWMGKWEQQVRPLCLRVDWSLRLREGHPIAHRSLHRSHGGGWGSGRTWWWDSVFVPPSHKPQRHSPNPSSGEDSLPTPLVAALSKRACVVGLHTCGALADATLRLAASAPATVAFLSVPCCLNRLASQRVQLNHTCGRPGTAAPDAARPSAYVARSSAGEAAGVTALMTPAALYAANLHHDLSPPHFIRWGTWRAYFYALVLLRATAATVAPSPQLSAVCVRDADFVTPALREFVRECDVRFEGFHADSTHAITLPRSMHLNQHCCGEDDAEGDTGGVAASTQGAGEISVDTFADFTCLWADAVTTERVQSHDTSASHQTKPLQRQSPDGQRRLNPQAHNERVRVCAASGEALNAFFAHPDTQQFVRAVLVSKVALDALGPLVEAVLLLDRAFGVAEGGYDALGGDETSSAPSSPTQAQLFPARPAADPVQRPQARRGATKTASEVPGTRSLSPRGAATAVATLPVPQQGRWQPSKTNTKRFDVFVGRVFPTTESPRAWAIVGVSPE
jgi:hypothetical protein